MRHPHAGKVMQALRRQCGQKRGLPGMPDRDGNIPYFTLDLPPDCILLSEPEVHESGALVWVDIPVDEMIDELGLDDRPGSITLGDLLAAAAVKDPEDRGGWGKLIEGWMSEGG